MSEFCCDDLKFHIQDKEKFAHDIINGKIYIRNRNEMTLMKYCVFCGAEQKKGREMTSETHHHDCEGIPVGHEVYSRDGTWYVDSGKDETLAVTYCPWCAQYL